MIVILFLLAGLAFVSGLGIFASAKSAIHEIEGFMLFLIAAVLLAAAATVEAINVAAKRVQALLASSGPSKEILAPQAAKPPNGLGEPNAHQAKAAPPVVAPPGS